MDKTVDLKINTFFGKYKQHLYKKHQVLIQANQNPDAIYKIESGQVVQYDISDQGHKVVVNTYKYPAYFPMSWAVNRTPNIYNYQTVADTVVRKVPAADAIDFIKAHPDVLYELLSRVYLGREVIMRRMAHSMAGNAKTRLLFELLLEAQRFGQVHADGKRLIVPIRVSDLADRTGLTRETVSRELAKMKALGILTSRNGIIVQNLKTLEDELGNSL